MKNPTLMNLFETKKMYTEGNEDFDLPILSSSKVNTVPTLIDDLNPLDEFNR